MTTSAHPTPAIHGGSKIRSMPWPVRSLFGEEEKAAVVCLFDRAIEEGSHLLGYNGEEEQRYMEAFTGFMGGGFADGVNSGTNALYVAIRALDLPPGSEVVVPPVTDPGGIMPVVLSGLKPIVADSAPGSYNTGAEEIARCLTERTSAIVVAHIAGIPVEMEAVLEVARSRGIPVVEDCAQAHGALYRGRMAGTWGAIASFSTMFGKHHASAGQGGIVFTRDEKLYWRARQMADRGKPFGLSGATQGNVVAALNCNMDELHAAIGRIQLARLPGQLVHRRRLALELKERLEQKLRTIRLVTGPADCESAWWFFLLEIDLGGWSLDKSGIAAAVQAEGVPLGAGYWHVPLTQAWYAELPAYEGKRELADLPNAQATEARHFMMSLHEGWTSREVEDLVAALAKVERAFCKE